MCLGRWLKLAGFFINICASLYLIYVVIFVGECKPSLWEYLTGKVYIWKVWRDLKVTSGANDRDMVITSLLIIIGSSLQMSGDLLDQ